MDEIKTIEQLFIQDHLELRDELKQKKAEEESLKRALSKTMNELKMLKGFVRDHTDPIKMKDGEIDQNSICVYFHYWEDEKKDREMLDYLLTFLRTEEETEEKEEKEEE